MAPAFRITRSRPHGHVDAVLSTMRKLGIPHLLGSKPSPERNACMALIAARILSPGSKLATSRCLGPETLTSTLAQECALPDDVDENHLYAAMDWISALRSSQIAELAAAGLIQPSLCDQKNLAEIQSPDFPGERPDVVAPKKPSPSAKRKARTKRCPDGLPVHSFRTLLEDLATITRNTIVPNLAGAPGWQQDAEPTPQQEKIIQLLKTHPMP